MRGARLAWLALAIGTLMVAVADPVFRDPEGHFGANVGIPLAIAIASCLVSIAWNGDYRRGSLWLGLLIVGQAATLQLIDAGRVIHYQHYFPFPQLFTTAPHWALVLTVGYALVVGLGLWKRRDALRTAVRHGRRSRWWVILSVAFLLTSATLSRSVAVYGGELVFATLLQAISLGAVYLLATDLPSTALNGFRSRFVGLVGEPGDPANPIRIDRFVVLAAGWVTVASAVLCVVSYQRHPHVPDEIVYLTHARYFAQGRLDLPAPLVPDGFLVDLMTYEPTRWYSPVPPGWPAALAVGAFFGAAWLVNPILAGINVILAYLLIGRLYDRRTARLTIILLCLSPWNLFMAMNFMTHTFTLTCALMAALAVALGRAKRGLGWFAIAGVGIGVVSLIRPLEGLAVALLCGVWAVWGEGGNRDWLGRVGGASVLTIFAVATGAVVLPYNQAMTGSMRTFPIMLYTDLHYGPGTNALGFGPNRGLGWSGVDPLPGHGPLDVLINANFNAFSINTELLGWATGSVLPLLFFFAWRKRRPADGLMLATIAMIAGIHSFYWFAGGPDFGARYWYLVLVPCLVLAVRGIDSWSDEWPDPAGTSAGTRPWIAAGALAVSSVACFLPWRAIDKYYHYRGMRSDIRFVAEEKSFGRSLVLIRGERHPDYASAVPYNPLDLTAAVPVYAWDRNTAVREKLLQSYPDRPIWLVDGPSITHAGYRIVAGPVLPHSDAYRQLQSRP